MTTHKTGRNFLSAVVNFCSCGKLSCSSSQKSVYFPLLVPEAVHTRFLSQAFLLSVHQPSPIGRSSTTEIMSATFYEEASILLFSSREWRTLGKSFLSFLFYGAEKYVRSGTNHLKTLHMPKTKHSSVYVVRLSTLATTFVVCTASSGWPGWWGWRRCSILWSKNLHFFSLTVNPAL